MTLLREHLIVTLQTTAPSYDVAATERVSLFSLTPARTVLQPRDRVACLATEQPRGRVAAARPRFRIRATAWPAGQPTSQTRRRVAAEQPRGWPASQPPVRVAAAQPRSLASARPRGLRAAHPRCLATARPRVCAAGLATARPLPPAMGGDSGEAREGGRSGVGEVSQCLGNSLGRQGWTGWGGA